MRPNQYGVADGFPARGECAFMAEFARAFPALAFFDWRSAPRSMRCSTSPTSPGARPRHRRRTPANAGSSLARMNLRATLDELLPHMLDLAVAEDAKIEYHSTLTRRP